MYKQGQPSGSGFLNTFNIPEFLNRVLNIRYSSNFHL
jgi:hypothetical protein